MKPLITTATLCLALIFSGCATTTVNSENADYKLNSVEQDALGNGLVQFFSGGLPNYANDATIRVSQDIETTSSQVTKSINKYGKVKSKKTIDGLVEISGRVGSGSMNMNPAGMLVQLSEFEGGTEVIIRAVAKEGMVKQNTSGKAVDRLIDDVETDSGLKITRI